MTKQELREPPLLSSGKIFEQVKKIKLPDYGRGIPMGAFGAIVSVAQTQWEADKKWMKEYCYLKAERELPENPYPLFMQPEGEPYVMAEPMTALTKSELTHDAYYEAIQEMLKEVNGVSFKAVGRWE